MTQEHRARERHTKIFRTAWSGLVAKVIGIAISLLMVPLAVHYLGKEQYGLWVAVSSLVAMMGFMEGGLGNAVLNMVAHATGANQRDLKKIVSTAFFCLSSLALIGATLVVGVFPFVSWGTLLGVPEPTSLAELNLVVIIVGLFFFVSTVVSLVGKIQRGLQEGNLDNFWNGVGAVLSLAFVFIAIQKDAGLVGFVIGLLAGPTLSYMASNIHFFLFYRCDLSPRLASVDGAIARNIFSVGGMFLVLQIAATIQGQADNLIIANMLGPGAVTNYSICMKLFLIPSMIFGLVLTPLAPAYREAFASGDTQWIRRIFLKSLRWGMLVSIPISFVLVILGGRIIELWVGPEVIPSTGLLIGFGLWMVVYILGTAASVFANALELITPQIIAATLSACANVVVTILLIPHFGAEGAVYGTLISYVFCVLPIYWVVLRKALN